ncbi:MAG: phosphoribosylamine--glycine ligase [Thermodesulfobacteriota bacterium]
MKVLVVGGGGREHALVWKIAQSPRVKKVYCVPGNAGIAELADCRHIPAEDVNSLLKLAQKERIDLTVVGPEIPLTLGIVDKFKAEGLRIFGPEQKAAEIEGSKAFAKFLMKKYGIPTADFQVFEDFSTAWKYVQGKGFPLVIKADGLAAGKGVIICANKEEAKRALTQMMIEKIFGEAGKRVIIEEYLSGEEASFLAFTDGESILPLPSAQDHKPIYDGDRGPNTGGMGAYSPAPVVTDRVHKEVMEEIMIRTVRGMAAEGRKYQGVLYAGLMIKDGQAKVLEFNARFGDPETQPLLLRLKSDIIPILEAVIEGHLDQVAVEWDRQAAVCVVLAAQGYPGTYEKGKIISGLEEAVKVPNTYIFHAGTALKEGKIVTNGGRVLGVAALGDNIAEAINQAYKAVEKISWDGVYYRRDIGQKALRKERP